MMLGNISTQSSAQPGNEWEKDQSPVSKNQPITYHKKRFEQTVRGAPTISYSDDSRNQSASSEERSVQVSSNKDSCFQAMIPEDSLLIVGDRMVDFRAHDRNEAIIEISRTKSPVFGLISEELSRDRSYMAKSMSLGHSDKQAQKLGSEIKKETRVSTDKINFYVPRNLDIVKHATHRETSRTENSKGKPLNFKIIEISTLDSKSHAIETSRTLNNGYLRTSKDKPSKKFIKYSPMNSQASSTNSKPPQAQGVTRSNLSTTDSHKTDLNPNLEQTNKSVSVRLTSKGLPDKRYKACKRKLIDISNPSEFEAAINVTKRSSDINRNKQEDSIQMDFHKGCNFLEEITDPSNTPEPSKKVETKKKVIKPINAQKKPSSNLSQNQSTTTIKQPNHQQLSIRPPNERLDEIPSNKASNNPNL